MLFLNYKKNKKNSFIKKDVNSLGNNTQSYVFIIINYRLYGKNNIIIYIIVFDKYIIIIILNE